MERRVIDSEDDRKPNVFTQNSNGSWYLFGFMEYTIQEDEIGFDKRYKPFDYPILTELDLN